PQVDAAMTGRHLVPASFDARALDARVAGERRPSRGWGPDLRENPYATSVDASYRSRSAQEFTTAGAVRARAAVGAVRGDAASRPRFVGDRVQGQQGFAHSPVVRHGQLLQRDRGSLLERTPLVGEKVRKFGIPILHPATPTPPCLFDRRRPVRNTTGRPF